MVLELVSTLERGMVAYDGTQFPHRRGNSTPGKNVELNFKAIVYNHAGGFL